MTDQFHVYSEMRKGKDGLYSVRLMLTPAELAGLQRAGAVGEAQEVIGMQDAAESVVAHIEMQSHICLGGALQ